MRGDEEQHGTAISGTRERLYQPSPPAPQYLSAAASSGMGTAAHNNISHCFPLSAFFALFLLPIYFKLFLSVFIISTFPFAPLFSSHSFALPHHLPSISPSLSCSFPFLPLPIPPSKQGNRNPKEEQELNLCQRNGPRGYIWNQQITEP